MGNVSDFCRKDDSIKDDSVDNKPIWVELSENYKVDKKYFDYYIITTKYVQIDGALVLHALIAKNKYNSKGKKIYVDKCIGF